MTDRITHHSESLIGRVRRNLIVGGAVVGLVAGMGIRDAYEDFRDGTSLPVLKLHGVNRGTEPASAGTHATNDN